MEILLAGLSRDVGYNHVRVEVIIR
jgi:hypothetical protein